MEYKIREKPPTWTEEEIMLGRFDYKQVQGCGISAWEQISDTYNRRGDLEECFDDIVEVYPPIFNLSSSSLCSLYSYIESCLDLGILHSDEQQSPENVNDILKMIEEELIERTGASKAEETGEPVDQ